ncbi:MAG: GDP-mannose 4,6-dehydratase, partial [Proteobacteria bacterium]|nr:GDP-mannose 4,6-dehydratase [Pseudomonadota bacterium]
KSRSIKDFLDATFGLVNLAWENYVVIDPQLFRPTEADYLEADASLARETIGWVPEISFEELVAEMVRSSLYSAVDHCEPFMTKHDLLI